VKGSAVKEGKSGRTVKGIYGWWSEVKGSAVKEGKSGRTVKDIYGWWSEGHVKIGVHYLWSNNIRN